ncbi:hypothetical protein GCM10009117_14760 [Gangjinia marincola]|uniref:SusE outer membrane protein domain-containing protein n=1 Tax=Gangjinia marincola TaxID=578463 RepID=A0ABN1MGL9_9FLAO
MKKILYFFFLSLLIGFNSSCEGDREELSVQVQGQPVLFDVDVDVLVLDSNNLNNPALTLQWDKADYGVQTAVQYDVELSNSADFEMNTLGATTSATTITWSVRELNNVLGNINVTPFEENEIFFRIRSVVGNDDSLPAFSEVISVTIVPYYTFPFLDIFLVGNACVSDWNNDNNNPPLLRSPGNPNAYSYTGFFNGDPNQFKILETRGQWQPQWGDTDTPGELAVNRGDSDDPGEFDLPGDAGYYVFNCELMGNTGTFTINAFEGDLITPPSIINISGSATDEAQSLELTQRDAGFDPYVWTSGPIRLIPGELNFIIDGNSLGGDTEFSGTASADSPAIPVVVIDDYEVWYYALTNEYHLIPLTYTN